VERRPQWFIPRSWLIPAQSDDFGGQEDRELVVAGRLHAELHSPFGAGWRWWDESTHRQRLRPRRHAGEQITAQGETFSLVTRLAFVQLRKRDDVQPLYYIACQEPKAGNGMPCNKRVDSGGFCAACNRVGKAAPRLNIRCRFSDYSDSAWLTTFHEAAQKVLATTSEEIQTLENAEDGREKVEALIRKLYFQQPMQLSIRARLDTYQGETRPNISCTDARPVQRGTHARAMLKSIKEMLV